MKKAGKISDYTYKMLYSSDSLYPSFYGLPKIPKPGIALRPIVSFVNSPTCAISGYPARILSPVWWILITLKIPIDLAVRVAKERLREDASLEQRTSLPVEDIIHLLSFCLKTTQFAYNGTYYQWQWKTWNKRALATSPVKPFFWKRYVDDVISAVSGNEAERLLSHLNSVEPSIQFTLEREKDRHLPFLDLNVYIGEQGNLETSVYRKPTPKNISLSILTTLFSIKSL